MKQQLSDTQLSATLETLRTTYPQAFIRLKKNAEMICEKARTEDMEKSYYNRQDCTYNVYRVSPAMRETCAWYFDTSCVGSQDSFFLFSPDHSCAALFHVSAQGPITDRCYLLNRDDVANAWETFESHLIPVQENSAEGTFVAPNEYPSVVLDFEEMFEEVDDDEEIL